MLVGVAPQALPGQAPAALTVVVQTGTKPAAWLGSTVELFTVVGQVNSTLLLAASRQVYVSLAKMAFVVQKVFVYFALNAKAPPTTANSAKDSNIIFTLFIINCFLDQKAKLWF